MCACLDMPSRENRARYLKSHRSLSRKNTAYPLSVLNATDFAFIFFHEELSSGSWEEEEAFSVKEGVLHRVHFYKNKHKKTRWFVRTRV